MPTPPSDDDGDPLQRVFQRFWQHRQFSEADLARLVKAVSANAEARFYLVKLSRRYPGQVLGALRAAYAGGDPAARAATLDCLSNHLGRANVGEVLRLVLAGDLDAEVREAAAWRAVRSYHRELAGEVLAASERDSGERRERLRLLGETLRDGHALQLWPSGDATLWISTPRSNFLQTYVSREALSSGGLGALIAEVRRWRVR